MEKISFKYVIEFKYYKIKKVSQETIAQGRFYHRSELFFTCHVISNGSETFFKSILRMKNIKNPQLTYWQIAINALNDNNSIKALLIDLDQPDYTKI